MARFDIISKDGGVVRYSGKPRYNGVYLKPSFLEFAEIASPTPISWEVGDYVDYPRTGMRYRLYSVPQASKNARKDSHGRAFTYSHVQFHAATKELEIALFRDLVDADNNIHFSSSSDVSTFENVEGIARRIQACMDDFYPGRWEIRIADFDITDDAEVIKKIGEAKEFALSGGTCLDALSKIYELWQDIGWVHTHEGGKEVIIIGYPNKRVNENTTEAFLYGKGNGLTAIKKNQTNREEFATRLYVYGSERNLPPRYYNGKDILNAESVDIRNLMIPLDSWGKTDGLPDARKAYLENAEAVAKYGVIPKTHYFDSDDAGADIYPSIKGMTIGMIRTALEAMGEQNSSYYPSEDAYPDSTQRVDVVRYCDNPTDDGSRGDVALQENSVLYGGKQRTVSIPSGSAKVNIIESELLASHSFTLSETKPCKVVFNPSISGYVTDDGFEKVEVKLSFYAKDSTLSLASATQKTLGVLNDGKWQFNLPSISYDYAKSPRSGFSAYIYLTITVTLASGNDTTAISYVLDPGGMTFSLFPILDKTFLIRLNEIGFDINAQASLGKGKAISMKTGMCTGRTFLIESCRHKSASGYWDFTVKRQQDNTLGLIFPNKDYQIAEGDEFVLIDIAMPELYVLANSQKLLSEGQKLLARASKIQTLYELSVDAKVMAESGRVLREGMFMEITDEDVVDNTTDYILIDTLSIYEDESAIPTYKVSLKERRKVTYKGTPSATSATETVSVEEDVTSNTEVDVDLSDYYTKEEINIGIEGVSKEIDTLADLLSSMWYFDLDGNLVTDKQVVIKNNLIVEQDTSSGGESQDTPGAGLDEDEVLDIVKGYTYSKSEINKLIDDVNAGDVDLTNYYTKQEVDAKIPSLDGYAKEGYVDDAITALNVGQYAKASDLDALQAEVDNIESVLGMDEEAEGIINTWNEVKAFLGSIEVDDDLASILEKMNANIATRALDSDLDTLAGRVGVNELAIADNAGNIKKNFDVIAALGTNKADKATTLAGYGITDAYTKSDLESYKTWWDDVMGLVVKEGNNIRIKTNLIVEGDTSSDGSGQDTPASGTVTGIKVNGKTYEPIVGIVTIPDYPTSLTWSAISGKPSFATVATSGKYSDLSGLPTIPTVPTKVSAFTNDSGYITGITKSMVDSVLGSTTAGNANRFLMSTGSTSVWAAISKTMVTDALGYTPLSTGGGTIDGKTFQPLIIDSSYNGITELGIGNKTTIYSGFGYANGYTFIGREDGGDYPKIGIRHSDGTPIYSPNNFAIIHTLLHSGNYADYALKIEQVAQSQTDNSWIQEYALKNRKSFVYNSNGDEWAYLIGLNDTSEVGAILRMGYASATLQVKTVVNGTWSGWKSVAFLTSTVANAEKVAGTGVSLGLNKPWGTIPAITNGGCMDVGRHFEFHYDNTTGSDFSTILQCTGNYSNMVSLPSASGTLALLTDNVASATKLQTARTLWGQSFDGTGNVDGLLTIGYGATTNSISNSIGLHLNRTGASSIASAGIALTNEGVGALLLGGNGGCLDIYTYNGTTASKRMLINSSGNVTIGDGDWATNVCKLCVRDGDLWVNNPNGESRLRLGGNTYVGRNADFAFMWNTDYHPLAFGTSGTERMRIAGNGAVTMSSTLTVAGQTTINNNLVVSGDTSSGSDIRFKDIIKNKTLKIEHIAKAPLFTFKWNDREDDTIHLGSSAQYWEKVTPWLVKGEDFKTLDYSTLGVAMGISLAKKAVNHEERIKELERKVKSLEEENRRLRYGN